jgi:ATP-binding protein involved in chromosome partitioning
MSTVTDELVLEALNEIKNQETGKSVVEHGLIQGLQIKEGHVGFAIEIEPSEAEAMEPLRKACEDIVFDLPGVLSVTAVLTAHSGDDDHGHDHGHDHDHDHAPAAAAAPAQGSEMDIPGVKTVIAVASGKGGVGKSTVSVNLALGLAANGLKVGLMDADVYGPSLPRMMGIGGTPHTPDGKYMMPMSNYGVEVMSMGFLVPEDSPMIWRGPMVMSALEQLLRDVKWGDLDVLVCDLPPGTGDAQLTMAQRVPLTGVVVVSTPQDVALADARKGIAMFDKVSVPTLGLIENMSYFICPHCGDRTEIFSHGGAKDEAVRRGIEFLGEIPIDPHLRETSDTGTPITAKEPDHAISQAFIEIARKVADKIKATEAETASAAPKIVIQ